MFIISESLFFSILISYLVHDRGDEKHPWPIMLEDAKLLQQMGETRMKRITLHKQHQTLRFFTGSVGGRTPKAAPIAN